jgi:hypothetical protein
MGLARSLIDSIIDLITKEMNKRFTRYGCITCLDMRNGDIVSLAFILNLLF